MAGPLPSPVTDAAPTRDEIIARAEALAPAIAARADSCERERRLPEESVADIVAAGLNRALQPAQYGGYQLSWDTQCAVSAILARACASHSWVSTVWADHNHMVGCFRPEAQDDIWGTNPDALVSSGLGPNGTATPVEGGYRLSGRWSFSSGIDHASWLICGAMLRESPDAPPEHWFLLVPQPEVTIIDDWHVTGLAGTGSKSFTLEDLFVPAHRAVSFHDGTEGTCPGNPDAPALYRVPRIAGAGLTLASVSLGAAEMMLDDFIALSCKRRTSPRHRGSDDPTALRIAESSAEISAVRLLVERSADEMTGLIAADTMPTDDQRMVWRRDGAWSGVALGRATQRLFAASGGSSIYTSSRLQRAFRDIHAGMQHLSIVWDLYGAAYGHHLLGDPVDRARY